MVRFARQFRNLGLGLAAFCLAGAFGLPVFGVQTIERAGRQRSRVQRIPRHRTCPVSQGPCALQTAVASAYHFADPPSAFVAAATRPIFISIGILVLRALPRLGQSAEFPAALPRPPPSFA